VTPLRVSATAPGRVNLIGDHTDYMGGLVLPMAIQLGVTVTGELSGDCIELASDDFAEPVSIPLPVHDPGSVLPEWGRYAAGVAAQLGATTGFRGRISSTLPAGSGLSSSAAVEVALALALGDRGTPVEVARRCQAAEQLATGVPCGIMDQLCSAAGIAGHALLIDCSTLEITPVRIPPSAAVWVVHSGERRRLVGSEYATRRSECEQAEAAIGPLRSADPSAIAGLADPVLRARARHVRSECDRVAAFGAAIAQEDLLAAGALMDESHRSLRDDFEVSTSRLDELVDRLRTVRGVYGARLTGGGFGGCAVVLADPEVELEGWRVRPSPGASVREAASPDLTAG
jgi:galactokinase